ncbi:MAG: SCO2522 family protein [Streptosporangiaceae bacterium]
MNGPEVPRLEVEVLTAKPRVEKVPRSHVSVELGHLYMEDLVRGQESLRRHFARIKPWADFVRSRYAPPLRVSTCFLVDDYFSAIATPKELVPELIEAAEAEGLVIDYLARESACASVGELSPAELVMAKVIPDPPPGTNGRRPPAQQSGWLTNSQGMNRPEAVTEAMTRLPNWTPPRQNGAQSHSICMDVQLWDNAGGRRRWSCALLAAVWQLLRLGVLRCEGEAILRPDDPPGEYPDRWDDLPPVVRLNERAQPFFAFGTMTVLETRFAEVEAAVRMILSQVVVDPVVSVQIADQAAAQGIELPNDLVRRVSHVFSDGI